MAYKILVVEDDVAMREIMTHKLTTMGFEVDSAEDGKQALDKIPKFMPALILLDLMLPEIDGFGVLEALRKNADKQIAAIPVIVLSNLWSNSDILKAKALQVQDYMVKAYFTPDEIVGKINTVLRNPSK